MQKKIQFQGNHIIYRYFLSCFQFSGLLLNVYVLTIPIDFIFIYFLLCFFFAIFTNYVFVL